MKEIYIRLKWAPHNLIAHPLMVFLPTAWGDWLHEITTPKGEGDNA